MSDSQYKGRQWGPPVAVGPMMTQTPSGLAMSMDMLLEGQTNMKETGVADLTRTERKQDSDGYADTDFDGMDNGKESTIVYKLPNSGPVPADFKTGLPLAEAEPIPDGDSASGKTDLRRKNPAEWQLQLEKVVRLCEKNNSADTQASKEGGGAPGTRAEVPLHLLVQSPVSQAVPLQPMEVHAGAEIHVQPMEEPTLEQVDAEGVFDPVGSLCWGRLLERTM
ncbi:hypothetical protein DUI87_12907 [Hirundo rustica rustica]|uniref:Uncharacterized protein n=1 Tax=Hirundo rustica rustica TaxID=333673 RepID=A0A3M0KAA5_HIRRU|nr:hypothetical protein DUI87_12907 [Hirundo rustica rustica]